MAVQLNRVLFYNCGNSGILMRGWDLILLGNSIFFSLGRNVLKFVCVCVSLYVLQSLISLYESIVNSLCVCSDNKFS